MKKIVMAAVLALSACMHTNAVLLDPSRSYRPVDPYDVVIYLTSATSPTSTRPSRSYTRGATMTGPTRAT